MFDIVGKESMLDFGEKERVWELDLGASGLGGYNSNGEEKDMRLTDSPGSESLSSGIGIALARRRLSLSPFISGSTFDSRGGTGTAAVLRDATRRKGG